MNSFEIRTYGRTELAQLYCPDQMCIRDREVLPDTFQGVRYCFVASFIYYVVEGFSPFCPLPEMCIRDRQKRLPFAVFSWGIC